MLGALNVKWTGRKNANLTGYGGENAPRGSSWRQLPLLLDARLRTTSPTRPSRSYYLWVRLRSLLSYSSSRATERAFVSWLRQKLYAAEFGALSLAWVKANAKRDLRVLDDDLFHWLTRHCVGDGEFISDGQWIRLRDVYDE